MQRTIKEELITPITSSCEVCVVGGGVAGIAAALAAAREGAQVTLIENSFVLGGLATSGLITIYLPLCDGMGEQVSFGIAEELLRLSVKHGHEGMYPAAWLEGGSLEERLKVRYRTSYNPHFFAIECEKLLLHAGVRILYGTRAVAVDMKEKKISAIIVENKSGRSAIEITRSVIDTSGDADICHLSGAETALFGKGNILAGWYYYLANGENKLRILGAADIPESEKAKGKSIAYLSNKRYGGIDGEEISLMVQESHTQMMNDIAKKREALGADVLPTNIPSIPQLRMTRRIVGKYTLDDTEIRKDFEDSIGMISDWRKAGPVYQIPFRTLYGDGVDNLITAGRCISVTDDMWDISRVIPACAVTGEAAGIAAAMSDCFASLDVRELQKRLKARGVRLK